MAVLRAESGLGTQGSLQERFRAPCRMPEIRHRLDVCKASDHPTVLSLQPWEAA